MAYIEPIIADRGLRSALQGIPEVLNKIERDNQRWGGVSSVIDRWLQERRQLVVRYCSLAGKEFGSVEEALRYFREFCQILVDYVSAGHFEVYEQLISEAREYNDGGLELARKVVPRLEASTGVALEFNDRFDQTPEELEELNRLVPVLERLGVHLEERFVLEDALIEKLHNAHAGQVA